MQQRRQIFAHKHTRLAKMQQNVRGSGGMAKMRDSAIDHSAMTADERERNEVLLIPEETARSE